MRSWPVSASRSEELLGSWVGQAWEKLLFMRSIIVIIERMDYFTWTYSPKSYTGSPMQRMQTRADECSGQFRVFYRLGFLGLLVGFLAPKGEKSFYIRKRKEKEALHGLPIYGYAP